MCSRACESVHASPGHQKAQAIHKLHDRHIPFKLRISSYHSPSGHVFVVSGVLVTVDTVLLLIFSLLLLLFSLDVKNAFYP